MIKNLRRTFVIPVELLLVYIEFVHFIISEIYLMIFNRVRNKKAFIKFNLIEFFQIVLIKIYNRLFNIFKLITRSQNDFPISRDKLLYYEIKSILQYAIKNNIIINNLKIGLDAESRDTIDKIIRNLYYIYTHSLIDNTKLCDIDDLKRIKAIKKTVDSLKEHIKLSIEHYEIIVFYFHCGLKFVPKQIINNLNDKDLIDGGAFIGDSALLFEKYYNPKRIYSFEPEINNYNQLLETIKINNLKKVIPINLGLGEKNQILRIAKGGKASHISSHGDYKVKIISIDDFVSKNNLSIGLIKLDVEGFAFKVLKGAINTIEKFKPILLIGIYHNGEEFFEVINLIKKFKSKYHYIIRLPPCSFIDETLLIAWVDN